MTYGSIEQTKRRRKKHGGMTVRVDCPCRPFCKHSYEWRQRNIDLLRVRNPTNRMIPHYETVQHEVDR